MELTGLDITLRRMQAIESTFNSLSSFGMETPQSSQDFQKILDAKMPEKPKDTPFADKIFSSNLASNRTSGSGGHADIDALIEQYSAKNGLDSAFVKAVIKLLYSAAQGHIRNLFYIHIDKICLFTAKKIQVF